MWLKSKIFCILTGKAMFHITNQIMASSSFFRLLQEDVQQQPVIKWQCPETTAIFLLLLFLLAIKTSYLCSITL